MFLETFVNLSNEMCDYKLVITERPIKENEKVILVNKTVFNKLISDMYVKVLANTNWEKVGYSKSYYYYILDHIKKLGLIEDNALSFKLIIPFIKEEKGLKLDESIIYLNGKQILMIDTSSNKYSCQSCPVFAECVYGLKRVSMSTKIKIKRVTNEIEARKEKLPLKLWHLLISNIISLVLSNLDSIYIIKD